MTWGFTDDLKLGLLEYSNGRAVTREGRCLWYCPEPVGYLTEDGRTLSVPAFNRDGANDADLKAIARREYRPRGVTDLASIPIFARRLLPADGPYVKPAVLHDDGYVSRGWGLMDRAEVDGLLEEAMRACGVAQWKRFVVYRAVRLGGGFAWGT